MQRTLRPNIAFAGLTAAGKTTHARILAEQLSYEYISYTALLLDMLKVKANPEKVWFTNYENIEKAREDDSIDIGFEKYIRELADSRDGLILDTWAMAYIYEGPLIRVWIESDEQSRMRKCYVSQAPMKALNLCGCGRLIHEKDSSARRKFMKRLNFDLNTDRSRYDTILSNTDLIPEPTDQCSRAGIHTFAPVVRDVVDYLTNRALHTASKESVQSLQAKYGTMVQKINEKPWSFGD